MKEEAIEGRRGKGGNKGLGGGEASAAQRWEGGVGRSRKPFSTNQEAF